ncbi:MAG: hypothetical protein ACYDEN_11840 [Acidimicrobiales bacterium]
MQGGPRGRPVGGIRRSSVRAVEANARLTAGTAVILLVLLAAEGVTILRIWPLLGPHVAVGLILVPPVLLKMASTSWRFVRYYLGDPGFRAKGPPAPALRLLGPFVVVLTVLLFASGIALLFYPNGLGGRILQLHKASFVLWFFAMAVHVLGHLEETGRLAPRDWLPRSRRRVRGANARVGLVVVSLVAGVVLAAALTGRVGHFRQAFLGHRSTGAPAGPTVGAHHGGSFH